MCIFRMMMMIIKLVFFFLCSLIRFYDCLCVWKIISMKTTKGKMERKEEMNFILSLSLCNILLCVYMNSHLSVSKEKIYCLWESITIVIFSGILRDDHNWKCTLWKNKEVDKSILIHCNKEESFNEVKHVRW